jgi:hypothetical protein
VGAAGVIATTVTAVKATPKALLLLEKAKEEKGEQLTKLEVVKVAGPAYVPTVVLGVSTLACIFGANVLNKYSQASIVSAYALVDGAYKDYRKKVDEINGKEAGDQVRAGIAKDKYNEQYEKSPIVPEEGKRLYYDYFSEQYFEATPFEVQRAEYEMNRTLMLDDCVYLDDWYRMIGLDPFEPSNNFGWTTCGNMDAYWQTWIDFHHQTVEVDDGLECTIISFVQDPFPDFEEWY